MLVPHDDGGAGVGRGAVWRGDGYAGGAGSEHFIIRH